MLDVHVSINGKPVDEITILKKELERSRHALRLLKDLLGAEGMRKLFEGRTAELTGEAEDILAIPENGKYVAAPTEFDVKGLNAQEFLQWWFTKSSTDIQGMMHAHPEHYMSEIMPDHVTQDVIEVNGALQTPLHILVKVHPQPDGAPEAPTAPIVSYCTAELMDGREAGSRVMHQFFPTADGFRARFCNYYPADADKRAVEEAQMHLAIEWSNWINWAYQELHGEN